MNLSFYSSAVGAQQQQRRLDVLANNIANINTNGFRAEQVSFASLMNTDLDAIGGGTIPEGSGAGIAQTAVDFSAGTVASTNRTLDYAIYGDGFFALQDAVTGEISYTRDGSFTLSEFQKTAEDGTTVPAYYLSDGEGRLVLSSDGAAIEVTNSADKQPVGVFDFVNTDGMQHLDDKRFAPADKNGQVRVGTGTVEQGMLETSNADLAESMVQVIEAQRSFTYALKMVQTSDEIESTVNSLRG